MKLRAAATLLGVTLAGCNAIWGVDDLGYAPAPTTTAAGGAGGQGGPAPNGGQGGHGGHGGQGGHAGAAGSTGGSGGVGGSGGQAAVLADSGLVVRYYLDEAASGQAPSHARDAAADPLDLPLTYSNEMSYVEVDGNRGLRWTSAGVDGRASISVLGTKLLSMLHGSTAATVELVADVQQADYFERLVNIGGGTAVGGDFGLSVPGPPTSIAFFCTPGSSNNAGEWPVELSNVGRVVLHLVVNTLQPVAADRARLFVDGAAAQLSASPTTPYVPLSNGATVDLGSSSMFTLGNKQEATRSVGGTLFYLALYASALTAAERTNNLAILSQSDDHP